MKPKRVMTLLINTKIYESHCQCHPLIALASLNRLQLLADLFEQVIVPEAVYHEVVVQGMGKQGATMLASLPWLQVMTPTLTPTIEPLLLGLGYANMV